MLIVKMCSLKFKEHILAINMLSLTEIYMSYGVKYQKPSMYFVAVNEKGQHNRTTYLQEQQSFDSILFFSYNSHKNVRIVTNLQMSRALPIIYVKQLRCFVGCGRITQYRKGNNAFRAKKVSMSLNCFYSQSS